MVCMRKAQKRVTRTFKAAVILCGCFRMIDRLKQGDSQDNSKIVLPNFDKLTLRKWDFHTPAVMISYDLCSAANCHCFFYLTLKHDKLRLLPQSLMRQLFLHRADVFPLSFSLSFNQQFFYSAGSLFFLFFIIFTKKPLMISQWSQQSSLLLNCRVYSLVPPFHTLKKYSEYFSSRADLLNLNMPEGKSYIYIYSSVTFRRY